MGGPEEAEKLTRRTSAFSLIEILVVASIVAILATVGGPAIFRTMVSARQAACLSNQRQIGLALHNYSRDNGGSYPQTTHSHFNASNAWIYGLSEYLDNIDEVRVCPAEPQKRKKEILNRKGTSYVLNDLVFDDENYGSPMKIPRLSQTMLLAILSESKPISARRDHIHGAEWTSYQAALSDIEADRHRWGGRSKSRTEGSANYLYADGSVRTITAEEFKSFFDRGINPAAVPKQ